MEIATCVQIACHLVSLLQDCSSEKGNTGLVLGHHFKCMGIEARSQCVVLGSVFTGTVFQNWKLGRVENMQIIVIQATLR